MEGIDLSQFEYPGSRGDQSARRLINPRYIKSHHAHRRRDSTRTHAPTVSFHTISSVVPESGSIFRPLIRITGFLLYRELRTHGSISIFFTYVVGVSYALFISLLISKLFCTKGCMCAWEGGLKIDTFLGPEKVMSDASAISALPIALDMDLLAPIISSRTK